MKLDTSTVALVTGAASGIGRGLALALAGRGVKLILTDVNAVGMQETVEMIKGVEVTSHILDVSSLEGWQSLAGQIQSQHGRLDLLVNNAGVALGGSFDETSLEDMQWLLGINFWGPVYGCKVCLPLLRQALQGHIVNISSVFGLFAPPRQTAYSATKFALRGFSESLRHELEGSTVKLSVVHPGGIKTNIARNARAGANLDVSSEAGKAELERGLQAMERAFVTSPEAAAERIVRGVERDEPRILIGNDARQADWIQRLFPATYWRIIGRVAPK